MSLTIINPVRTEEDALGEVEAARSTCGSNRLRGLTDRVDHFLWGRRRDGAFRLKRRCHQSGTAGDRRSPPDDVSDSTSPERQRELRLASFQSQQAGTGNRPEIAPIQR